MSETEKMKAEAAERAKQIARVNVRANKVLSRRNEEDAR